jgi:hypothetical protein
VESGAAGAISAAFPGALEEAPPTLRVTGGGACVLFEPAGDGRHALCALHRTGGHAALPSSCRHFPRIYLHDAAATRVTLSHYCPTAASLLFEPGGVRIVDAPPGLAPPDDQEGLDARDALPPLLRPGMLMDAESYATWERGAIELLGSEGTTAGDALSRVAATVERLRDWHPDRGPLVSRVRQACVPDGGRGPTVDPAGAGRPWYALALSAVPAGLTHGEVPDELEALDARYVEPCWNRHAAPMRRYLSGRLFGSWTAYQGRGLRTVVASLLCALAVVRIEAVRACAKAARPLDASLLRDAIRQADLLLVHKADRQTLASALSAAEFGPAPRTPSPASRIC